MSKVTVAQGARELAKVMADQGGGEAKVKQKVSVKVKLRKAFGADK